MKGKIKAQSSGPGADTYYVSQYGERGRFEGDFPVIRRYVDQAIICLKDQSETCAHAETVRRAKR